MTIKTKLLIPRRKALLGAAGLAALPFAAPHVARAADPIKIGLLLAKTGQIAGQTEYLANGSILALEQRNNTIMGQPAELVWLDEPSPQGATQNMQKLVQENKVCAVLGGALSSNALAEEAKAAELKIPFVCDNAAATDITGKNCNRYTFRLNTPVAVQCADAGALCPEVRQEVVSHHGVLRLRPGHPEELARAAEGSRRHGSRRRRGAAEHRRLQLVHPEDPPGQAGRGGGRPVGRRPLHLPEAMERARHEGQDPVRRDRDRRHRHLGRRARRRERHLHQAVGRLQSRTTRRRRRRSPRPT